METRKVTVSFVVNVDGNISSRDLTLYWIEIDSAEAIADAITDTIVSIE